MTKNYIPTGIKKLDKELNGGIQKQCLTEISGKEGSGRNIFAHNISVQAILPKEIGGIEGETIYIDTRNIFKFEKIFSIIENRIESKENKKQTKDHNIRNLVRKKLHVKKSTSVEEQILSIETIEENWDRERLGLVVVDSIISLFLDEYEIKDDIPIINEELNKHLHDLHRIAEKYNSAVVFTNNLKENGEPYGSQTKDNIEYKLEILKLSEKKREIKIHKSKNKKSLNNVKFQVKDQEILKD